jgi:Tfp pilus assembly protein PilF
LKPIFKRITREITGLVEILFIQPDGEYFYLIDLFGLGIGFVKSSMEDYMNYEQVKRELSQMFENGPKNIRITGKLASAYMETRDFEGALKVLKKAVEIEPNEYTLTNLGYFYLYEGEPNNGGWFYQVDKAIEMLERAIQFSPKSYQAYSVLGEAYLLKEKNLEAEKVLKQAVDIEETTPNMNNLGVALYKQEKYQEAADYFEKAHQRREEDYSYSAYFNLALCLAKTHEHNRSLLIAKELLENEKNDIGLIDLTDIAYLFYENDDFNGTINSIEEALKTFEVYPNLFGCYVFSLITLNRTEDAWVVLNGTLQQVHEQIEDTKSDEDPDWDEKDRKARIDNLEREYNEYQLIYQQIQEGIRPKTPLYLPRRESDCYLFGCLRHHIE